MVGEAVVSLLLLPPPLAGVVREPYGPKCAVISFRSRRGLVPNPLLRRWSASQSHLDPRTFASFEGWCHPVLARQRS